MSGAPALASTVTELLDVLRLSLPEDGHTHNCKPFLRSEKGCSTLCKRARTAITNAEMALRAQGNG